jgi:hypothetical protein
MTGNLDEVATQWKSTDPESEKDFENYVKAVIKSGYEVLDEDGEDVLLGHFEMLNDISKEGTMPIVSRRPKSAKIFWPVWCYQMADDYKGPHTLYVNWRWVNANYPHPDECKSMFRDPRVVSI